jgi:hypothetical protein
LPQWRVDTSTYGIVRLDRGADSVNLDYVLMRLNVAPAGLRFPVLWIGEHMGPDQILGALAQHAAPVWCR